MSCWLASQNHSLVLTLLAGLACVAGLGGVGLGLLRHLRLDLPAGFTPVTALALGTLLLSLGVFCLGALQAATPAALLSVLLLLLALGFREVGRAHRSSTWTAPDVPRLALALFLGIGGAALCVAVAPPVHPDDGYYHLLAPARLLSDGGLRFYLYPLQSAVVPQMGYQLSAAPLHAAGVPGAWAVLGAAFWGTLVWLGAVRAHLAGHRAWTGLVVAGLVASFYPTIWYATSGAHGMGDATFAGAVLLALVGQGTGRQRLAPVVILLVAAASTKVTLLPMILVVWVSVSAHAWRISPREARGELAVMAIVPWLIWQGLPLGWTWMHSGSPWGPIFANVLGESVYDVPALQKMLASGWASGRYDLPRMALFALGFLNPVLWLGLAWAVVRSLVNREHLLLPGLVALQVGLMTFAVPLDARYLGGLQFVGLLTLAAHPPTRILSALARPVGIAVATLLTVPWALLGAAEAADAARVATGQLTANSYCEDALPLYESFGDLDAALPPDAALLALRNVGGTKLPNAYAPRPIAMMPEDLPPDRRPFLLWVGPNDRDAIERAVTRRTPYRLGPPMFEPRTVEWSTRGRRPGRATVGVYALESATEPPTGSAARPPQ